MLRTSHIVLALLAAFLFHLEVLAANKSQIPTDCFASVRGLASGPKDDDSAAETAKLLEEIRESRSIFIDPFLFMTDQASGRAIWDGLHQAFPLLAKTRKAVNLAHQEQTDLDPTLVKEVLKNAKAALKTWTSERKDATPVDGAYIALNTINEVFTRQQHDAEQKQKEKQKEKQQQQQQQQKQKDKGKPQPPPPPEFPDSLDKYKPHNKDTDSSGNDGPPQPKVSLVEVNEPDIQYFKTDHFQLVGPDGWYKVPVTESIRIQPAGGATHVLKVRPYSKIGQEAPVHVPMGFVPLEVNNSKGKVWKDSSGNYKFLTDQEEFEIPLIPQGKAARPLSPQEQEVYTTPTGFKFEDWPDHFKRDVELVKSEYEKGNIDKLGVAKIIEALISQSKVFKYAVDADKNQDIVALVNKGAFQCDTATTLAVSVLRDQFKIASRPVGGDVGHQNPRTPMSSHVVTPAERHAWFEVPDDAGNWHGFDATPKEKDREVKPPPKGDSDDFSPISKEQDEKDKKDQDQNGKDGQDGKQSKDQKQDQQSGSKGQKSNQKSDGQQKSNGKDDSSDGDNEGDSSHDSSAQDNKSKGDSAPHNPDGQPAKTTKELIDMAKKMLEDKKEAEKKAEEAKKKQDGEKGDQGSHKNDGSSDKKGEKDSDKEKDDFDNTKKDRKAKDKSSFDKLDEANPFVQRLIKRMFDWAMEDHLDERTKSGRLNALKGIMGSPEAKQFTSFQKAKDLLNDGVSLFKGNRPPFEKWANEIVQGASRRPLNETIDELVQLKRQAEWTCQFRTPAERAPLEKIIRAANDIIRTVGSIKHKDAEKIRIVEELMDNLPGNISRNILRNGTDYLNNVSVGANQATVNLANKLIGKKDSLLSELRVASALGPHTDFLVDPVYLPSQGEQRTVLRDALPSRKPKGLQITNDPRDRRTGMLKLNPFISDQQALRMGQMAVLTQNKYVKTPAGLKGIDPEKATILCVDMSGSMTGDKIDFQSKYIAALVDKALSDVNPGGKAKHRVYILPFDDKVYDAIEVTSAKEATALLTNKNQKYRKASGGTDIEAVLIAAAKQIKTAGESSDKALARATVVLASDGGAEIDYKKVSQEFLKARKTKKHGNNKDLQMKFGFVAIGESNPDLVQLARDSDQLGADSGMYLEFDNPMIDTILGEASRTPKPENDFWTDVTYANAPLDVRTSFGRLANANGEYRVALSKPNPADSGTQTQWLKKEAYKPVEKREDRREGSQKATLWRFRDALDLVGGYFDAPSRKRILEGVLLDWNKLVPKPTRELDTNEISQMRHLIHWPETGTAVDPKYVGTGSDKDTK